MKLPSLDQESPLHKAFYEFDVEHISWGLNDYILNAVDQSVTPISEINKLWIKEIHWRKDHKQNIVASMEGSQGSGKSMPFSYVGLLIGSIFGVPFKVDNIFFTPEDLDLGLQNAKPKETFLRDEHLYTRAGLMSNFINENLADYEEQLRINQNNLLFCSVNLQNHAHFFCFESKHINFNENGYPESFVSILKTPRYTDRKEFVWRGYVSFRMPNEDFVAAYLEKKNSHITNLKKKYGNTLDPVSYYANEIFKEKESVLIMTTKEGFVKPIKAELMEFIIADVLGTRKFTNKGYALLLARVKQLIVLKYEQENKLIAKRQEEIRTTRNLKVSEILKGQDVKAEIRRNKKFEFMRLKLEEEKRKNDLKERALKLKEEYLEKKEKMPVEK